MSKGRKTRTTKARRKPAKKAPRRKPRVEQDADPEPGTTEAYERQRKITIYLSGEWPIEIQTKNWPVLRDVERVSTDGMGMTCYVCLRTNSPTGKPCKNYKAILYGYTYGRQQGPEPALRELQAGGVLPYRTIEHADGVAAAVLELCQRLNMTQQFGERFIAKLPPLKFP